MHRVIMGDNINMEIDHVNHCGLDNRKINLRECTRSSNAKNMKIRRGKKFKGIHKSGRGFTVVLTINNKQRYFGTYPTEREAAWLYNKLAVMYFGEFANPNRVPG